MIKNKVGTENKAMQAPKICFQEFIKQQQQDQEQDKDEGVKDLSMSKSAIMENILKQANLLKQVPQRWESLKNSYILWTQPSVQMRVVWGRVRGRVQRPDLEPWPGGVRVLWWPVLLPAQAAGVQTGGEEAARSAATSLHLSLASLAGVQQEAEAECEAWPPPQDVSSLQGQTEVISSLSGAQKTSAPAFCPPGP